MESREIAPEKALPTPLIKVRMLQERLHAKAKESPELRFHFLHDKVWRADVLEIAYYRCEANKGTAGVDGQAFADIEAYGLERWLGELAQELRTTFTFLGFTFGRQYSWKTGRAYLAPTPATKKVQAICDKISVETCRQTAFRTEREQVTKLNQMLVGWANYFRLGYVTAAWRTVQQHACRRLRRWLRCKHKERSGPGSYDLDQHLDECMGLANLVRSVRRLPLWANP